MASEGRVSSKTGGRGATSRHIPGDCALSVGFPTTTIAPRGWRWTKLTDVARLESGHTPSRNHPEYWGGDIPWLSIRDARANHGGVVETTAQQTNTLGILNSSARVLPKNTVCLSRTASVGYVVILGRDMATSQDFVNWVCSSRLYPQFLKYLLLAEGRSLLRFASGATHQTIYYPEVKAFHVCLPSLPEQKRVVAILEEAFAKIDEAVVDTKKNLASARELFEAQMRVVFDQSQEAPRWMRKAKKKQPESKPLPERPRASVTRGRAATKRIIPGELSLSVGKPPTAPRPGWRWSELAEIAQLESGHTPSRRHPEYWEGLIPWIGIRDAKANHGKTIFDTEQHTNELGIANSAARLLPAGTVCLSRTASVGYVVVMGKDMATSQDFVDWVCSPELEPHYLKYLLLAESTGFSKYSSGAVHQTIYYPEVKAFHVCHPSVEVQRRIVHFLDDARARSSSLVERYSHRLSLLSELRQAIFRKAYTGGLPTQRTQALSEATA